MGFETGELKSLSIQLAKASGQVGGRLSAVVKKTAHDIEATAKSLAPVDTGNLQNSISTEVVGDGRFGAMSAEIGPTVDYGAYVEEGTTRMAPQPYMSPAAETHMPAFEAAVLAIGDPLA